MTNGNGQDVNRIYTDALTAQLGERVTNLNRRQSDLETEMRSGFKQIESSMTSMSSEMRSAVASLSTNLAERNRTPWAIIIGFCSVSITILGGLGFLALQPIKDNIAQIRDDGKVLSAGTSSALASIVDKMVTQKEMEWRTARGQEDRQRMEAGLKELRSEQVPRGEHERVWASYDQRFSDQQRQIDEVKQAQGSVYGQRDIILDLRGRLDRIERQRLSGSPG
ncbi:hypothetical protein [Shinella sp. M31]|uniref:hypothetical protein n=1 Tax=Shinella sp. M31 TaxID=3368615 RepID=UPI003BA103B5